MIKLRCPKCHRILGESNQSFDGILNCRWCKDKVKIRVVKAETYDYFTKCKLNGGEND